MSERYSEKILEKAWLAELKELMLKIPQSIYNKEIENVPINNIGFTIDEIIEELEIEYQNEEL